MPYYSSGRLSQHLLLAACLAAVVGLLAARALVALSPVVGVLAALANPHLGQALPAYFRNGAAMRAAALVGFLLLTGFYTSEWASWRHELFRSLPWLAVPLAFTVAVPLTGRQRRAVGVAFVLGTAAVGAATLGKYLLAPGEANAAIRIGQNMQAVTRIFHVSFGVMLALAFFWGLLLRHRPAAGPWLRPALLAAALVAALTLHVLAYRTGLLVFYAAVVGYAGWLLAHKQWRLGLCVLGSLLLGAGLAYYALDSVRERAASTAYDIQQFTQGHDMNNYSLARRLTAAETAALLIREHWLLGVGPADAHAAMAAQYRWRDYGLRPANQADVHNQYLAALLGGGVIGLAVWLAVVFWPVAQAAAWRSPATCFFILIQAVLMMVADITSLQIGLNLFVFGYGFLVVAGEQTRPGKQRS